MLEISACVIFGFLILSLIISIVGRSIEKKYGFNKTVEILAKSNVVCYFGVILGIILLFISIAFF